MKLGKFCFKGKNISEKISFDSEKQIPVIKCSICTGEQVAGFKDKNNGSFTEVMIIKTNEDIEYFKKMYQIETIKKEY